MIIEMKLSKYIKEAEKAKEALSKKLGINISDLFFQKALGEALGYDEEDSTRIIDHDLTAEEMLDKLKDFDFKIPEVIGNIKFDHSILPEDVPQRLDEKEIKHKGEIWVIHKNDKDPFPSNPHAHNMETGYKLHLGNGELFSSKNKPLNAKISKKYLIAIRDKVKNMSLPKLSV